MSNRKFDPAKLDFDTIMSKMKTYFEESGEFNDYDFEGSGLQALMRVLAWNTHMNAMVANFASNEAFLDTAQIRGSVTSHAKALGYLPRSRRSASVRLRLTLSGTTDGDGDVTIPKWTRFTTSIDGISYTFYTLDEYTATEASGWTVDVIAYEGKKLTKRFIVDTDDYPVYVIPTADIDTSTITMKVKDGLNSAEYATYTPPTDISNLVATDQNYFMAESPNGYYEFALGDGLIGKKPPSGSVIDVEYLKSSADVVNGAVNFATSDTVAGYSIGVFATMTASGGTPRETIESVRFNAPKAFAAQNRLVTVNDYKTYLQSEVPNLETLNVWGGEDNDPPNYGRVYICIKPTDADALSDSEKAQIKENIIDPRAVITVEHELVDPKFQYIEVRMNVNYDARQTTLSQSQLESKIKDTILEYEDANLSSFSSAFRKSRLISFVDDSDLAVLSVDADILLQRRLIPTLNVKARYDLNFSTPIASVSDFDTVVTSDRFNYTVNGVSYPCFLRNKSGTNTLEIYRTSAGQEVIVIDDAGYIDTANNKIVLLPFEPSGFPDAANGIRFSVRPANDNVLKPQRDLLIRIDDVRSSVNAEKDA